jgi:hypothetical protein
VGGMLVLLQLFDDVDGHQDVKGLFVVNPNQFDAVVEVAHPILGKVVLCVNHCNQMVNVLLTLVFHSKIVNNKDEGDGARCVFSEAILAFLLINVGDKTLAKEFVGEDASLMQSPDSFSHLEVDVVSNDIHLEVV